MFRVPALLSQPRPTQAEFGVDDIYHVRDWKMRLKLPVQRGLAGLFGWHFAVAMYAICQRVDRSAR